MARTDLPIGTVTFVFTDIEGSTRLVASLGDRFLDVHARHQAIVRAAIAANRGLEVSTEGDSFFAVFGVASDAVAAAAGGQRALHAEPWPQDATVRVRMGIHTGQGIRGGDNYVGIDVNRAARIAAAGTGGQVLVSETTRDAVEASLQSGLSLRDLGRHRLKDVGVEHLWQLDLADLPASFGPLRTLEAHPSNIPAEVTPLVDRDAERARLRALVESSRLVTVTGPGGIGKSRVAARVALDLVPDLPDGAFYVDAAPLDTADLLADELARVVGGRLAPGTAPADSLLEFLRNRSLLLFIDTADRVRNAGGLLSRIASACVQVHLLVTSRTPLRIAAERELPLEPLGVATSGLFDQIAGSPAVALFVTRAQAMRPDFALTRENAAAVAEICARLDGVPLAIELAAARVRVLPPQAIVGRLARSLALLTGGGADAPDRQRTLRATIDWSYELLSDGDRRALTWLAVFAGTFPLDAAEAVLPAASVEETAVDVVGRLVDQGLLVASGGDEPHFRLLGTIREFALEMLDGFGDGARARMAHAEWCGATAARWAPELEGAGDLAAVVTLEGSIEEFRSALGWLLAPEGDAAAALQLAASLGRFWYLRGRPAEGRRWLERALEATAAAGRDATAAAGATDAALHLRGEALYWAGVLADEGRLPGRAVEHLSACLEIRRSLGDERGIARALNSLGVVARAIGDLDRAEALFTESLERKRAQGDESGVAATISNLGVVAADRDDLAMALRWFEEALALDRRSGDPVTEAYSLINVGAVHIWSGEIAAGMPQVRSALRVFTEVGDPGVIADALEALGIAAMTEGANREAVRFILAARSIREREGTPSVPADVRRVDAALATATSRLSPAEVASAREEASALDIPSAVRLALGS